MITEEDLARVEGMTSREAAKVLGVGKTSINRARAKVAPAVPADVDGSVTASQERSDAPYSLEDAEQVLGTRGIVLSRYNASWTFSDRTLANGTVVYRFSVRLTPKKEEKNVRANVEELVSAINTFDFVPAGKSTGASFVLTPSDLQIGKTSFNGGTDETVDRVLASLGRAEDFVKEYKPREIIIADLGDTVENFYNTSSQRETNDLDITGQIRVARRLLLEGVKRLAPHSESVRFVSVPSNHGTVRLGFKAPAGDNHNDWGLEIASQIEDAVRENARLDHVRFVRPEHLYESVSVVTSNTKIGFVHGHQAGKADRLGEWWKGQDHGRQPVHDADILLAGHFHSFRVYQSGNERWVMVSPASDPGSDWFTNITGETSRTGMLSFTTEYGMWDNLRIL